MRNRTKLFSGFAAAFALLPTVAFAGTIKAVELTPGKDRTILQLRFDGAGKFRVFQSEKQGSVVVEAEDLVLPPHLARVQNVSAAGGPVLQLTPYSAGDAKRKVSKFVLQLRSLAEVASSDLPGQFVLEVRESAAKPVAKAKPRSGRSFADRGWSEVDELRSADGANEKSDAVARQLVEVLNAAPEAKNYFGSTVTFVGSGVDVHDVFRLVGAASGLNIVTDSDVNYRSNYSLQNIPWDQLLDIVVQQAQLKAAVSGNVVRIMTQQKYADEQAAKLNELDIADELEPVVMAVIPLSFAQAEQMKTTIEMLLVKRDSSAAAAVGVSPAATTVGAGAPSAGAVPSAAGGAQTGRVIQDFVRGQIQVDSRSNSLIVTNTRETIERIRKLVKELDVALPQVLIDAKIVIASEQFTRKIGVAWGGRASSTGSGRAGIGAGFNFEDPLAVTGATAPTFSVSPGAAAGGVGFQVGAGRHGNLNAQLQLSEVNGISQTVASPRVIVNNKKKASIIDGQTLTRSTTAGANSAGELQQIKAQLDLQVTPQVTSVGSVLLDISLKKDSPLGGPGGMDVENKQVETQVLVDSGSTLVLGGVYQFLTTKGESGIPLLKDLPFLGALFRTNENATTKNELMVFITPEIIDVNPSKEEPAQTTAL